MEATVPVSLLASPLLRLHTYTHMHTHTRAWSADHEAYAGGRPDEAGCRDLYGGKAVDAAAAREDPCRCVISSGQYPCDWGHLVPWEVSCD